MYESIGFINHTEHRIIEAIIIAKKNKPGTWERLPHSWYKISMGTDFWLPKPPAEGEVVYVARNLFYKPQGARQLHKNNDDCWSMLITEGPKEMLGQEITWFSTRRWTPTTLSCRSNSTGLSGPRLQRALRRQRVGHRWPRSKRWRRGKWRILRATSDKRWA